MPFLMKGAVLAVFVLLAPSPTPTPIPSDMHSLLVYGKGWTFGAQEPDGWTGYTDHSADVGSNLYFLPIGQSFDQGGAIIRVTILPKDFGDDVGRDLASDMDRYKKAIHGIKFTDFFADYPGGAVYAKIYGLKRGDEYVAYVNPGHKANFYFIVDLDPPPAQPVSEAEVSAFRSVIKTLTLMSLIVKPTE